MNMLKKDYKDWYNQKKMIGVYVSRSIDQYLSMICLDRNISKSSLIRELLEGYIQKKKIEGLDEKTLMENISKILEKDWGLAKKSNKGSTYAKFIEEATNALLAKGIDKKNIEIIVNNINE